ncbi:E3 ubiquitin-protein ligase TRIM39-like [Parambassis ranga]|uniref:E3 ubiquitin-protein ligase TRIM39-like n=1 Tax=Parambassis ranga TaxID=210632 RepID=A0A6P7HWX5_9TELE|nr:E3 ubiquitin-protein ligase TRIM39-like [Parambassis ranga]XP_028256671.1 E3 ubiquitin-protein ligase TRIM39-like [Parambassis ranga]
MASASSLLCEEQFLCSICLHVFTDPVTTPCGHNYCKSCITEYWNSCDLAQCPLCKERFRCRPQLRVNTGFRDMVENFSKMGVNDGDDIFAKPGEVPCDICSVPKLKAQKTCLVCKVSYCQPHLESHRRVKRLKKHRLTDPVSKPEERVCMKHGKIMNLFCSEDQVCVCFMCMMDNHVTHNAIPLEEAYRKKRAWIESVMPYANMMENSKTTTAEKTKHSFQQKKKESDKEISDIKDTFRALEATLQRNQVELIDQIQEEQKRVERHTEAYIRHLEGDAAELKRARIKMEQALQTEDHFHFLKNIPSFDFIDRALGFDTSRQSYVEMVKRSLAQIEKTLSKEMERLMRQVGSSDGPSQTDGFNQEVWDAPQDKLMMIQQYDAVNVTLDPYTAYSHLVVSGDRKQLTVCESDFNVYGIVGRNFLHLPFVLASDGFSSGRFYYEVQVSGSKAWLLGVVKEPIKKDTFFFPVPEEGGWTLSKMQSGSDVYTVHGSSLYLRKTPKTVGVFVDYEKGEVSFYDVEARTLIYSYTKCTFIETIPTVKAVLYSVAGYSTSGRSKLYPVFGMLGCGSEEKLVISPVSGAA